MYGHTHRQFDRQVADRRLVKAGAVGMPYRATRLPSGRYSALTSSYGRRTRHDIEAAVRTLRAAGPPDIDELMLRAGLIVPADADEVSRRRLFGGAGAVGE